MINVKLNGTDVQAEEGWTILDTCNFYGIDVPTLCHHEGLSDYGACRLCLVEVGEGKNSKLVSSCTYPVNEGLKVRTYTNRILKARKIVVELMLARCPTSKKIQDLASKLGVTKVRFKLKNDNCILCGLCSRMCKEQMDGKAIGFVSRGKDRKITTPFDMKSDVCKLCGGCMYICPACELRCQASNQEGSVCNSCLTFTPECLKHYDDAQCFMIENCGTCIKEKPAAIKSSPQEMKKNKNMEV